MITNHFSSHLFPKPLTYFYASLIDEAARIFPNSNGATSNRTHASSVASLLRDIQDALPTELPWHDPT